MRRQKRKRWSVMVLGLLCNMMTLSAQSTSADVEKLGKALDYFNINMYHEALLLFSALDKEYELNARFHAYMGLCYYYEWDYQHACSYLDKAIPQVDGLAPHERSMYYFANAESHFNLNQYSEAIPFYEQHVVVCYPNEKADSYYRIGFCYMFAEQWENAMVNFESSLAFYSRYPDVKYAEARMKQLTRMIEGCSEKLKSKAE